MQQDNEQGAAGRMSGMSGRSSVERLPLAVRNAVDAATADGNTIDEIAAVIRVRGGDCSRSAVGRYFKRERDLIRQQREAVRNAESWVARSRIAPRLARA